MNLKKRVIESGVMAVSLAILTAVTSISGTVPADTQTAYVQETAVVEDTRNEVATIEKREGTVVTATQTAAATQTEDADATVAEETTEPETSIETAEPVSASVGVNATAAATAATVVAEENLTSDKVEVVVENTKASAKAEDEETSETDESDEAAEAEETDTTEETVEDTTVASVWDTRLMANVEDSLNVRASADDNAEIVGKLYKGAIAEVVEVGEVWTHIQSGNVDGYVKNEYCVYGTDAENLANQVCTTYATALTGGLRIRSEANADAEILDVAAEGDKLTVNTGAEAADGWVAVNCDDVTAYVSAEFVSVELEKSTAITIEEEQARIAAEEAEKAAAAAAAAAEKAAASATTQNAAVAASVDEVTMLGALIQCEAGGESYEGKVAVGAVVMNRVRSGSYPSSISGVIYQSGQFTTAGSISSVAASGVNSSCLQAAQEAINGTDNTGGATSFKRASSGQGGVVIGNHVFY